MKEIRYICPVIREYKILSNIENKYFSVTAQNDMAAVVKMAFRKTSPEMK